MTENFSRDLRFVKEPVRSRGGVVSAQNQKAADIGAAILRQGGNAIDAAVATGLALGALEPWMSGIGAIGYMTVWDARRRRGHVVEFGAVSAAALDPADYPLTGKQGGDLFGWPEVEGNRNILGPASMAVPGQVEGMRVALERFGTRRWADLAAPAVECAETGLAADWWATLVIASAMGELAQFPASKAWFLPNGAVPCADWNGHAPRLRNEALARSLRRLRDAGPRDFYDGALARTLAAELERGGSAIRAADLAGYAARVHDPLMIERAGMRILTAPGLTAGPSLADCFARLGPASGAPDAAAFVAYAEALSAAYERRLAGMGVGEAPGRESCTTHFSIVDGAGNAAAVTQSLLSLFGSRVVLPETGVLMNNGIMWFDPRPGGPNAIGPAKRPLSNMLPTLVVGADGPVLAIGASGGRRILPAVFQLVSFLTDRGMEPGAAMHRPRIDVSAPGQVAVDPLLPGDVKAALAARFGAAAVTVRRRDPFPLGFACPVAVAVDPASGERIGFTEIAQPWAGSAAA